MWRRFGLAGGACLLFALTTLPACKDNAAEDYQRGVRQWSDGRHYEAISTLRVITRDHPASEFAPQALLKVAQIQAYDLERYEEAESTYQLFLKLYGQSSHAIVALEELTTLLFEKKKDYLRAIKECQRFIDSFPTSPQVPRMHRRIVSSYIQLRDFQQARVEAGLFLRKFPHDPLADDVAYDIPRSYFIQGKPEETVKEARKLLSERPQSKFAGRTQFLLAAALEDSDRLVEALEAYKIAREWHPEPSIVDGKIMAVEARIARKHN
jgi:outer membrane protein assembly factor BamD (BamD/ComL family)